jgi:hypothetical protein
MENGGWKMAKTKKSYPLDFYCAALGGNGLMDGWISGFLVKKYPPLFLLRRAIDMAFKRFAGG